MNVTVDAVGLPRAMPLPTFDDPEATETMTMYDMYPEWGPVAHDDDRPAHPPTWSAPVQESLDRRDNGGEPPEHE